MTNRMIDNRIRRMMELEAMMKALADEHDELKDEVEIEMDNRKVDEINTGKFIVRYKGIVSNRFDTKAFKEADPETYELYTKISTSRRFTHSEA